MLKHVEARWDDILTHIWPRRIPVLVAWSIESITIIRISTPKLVLNPIEDRINVCLLIRLQPMTIDMTTSRREAK